MNAKKILFAAASFATAICLLSFSVFAENNAKAEDIEQETIEEVILLENDEQSSDEAELAADYVWDGETIASKDDLVAFAAAANAGNSFSGKTVTLTADIDLEGMTWTPVKNFLGTFDGGKHTISNFHLDATKGHAGFFYKINYGNGTAIKDLTLSDITATVGNYYVGAFAYFTFAVQDNITIKNFEVTTTSSEANVGGYAGWVEWGHIRNCTIEDFVVDAEKGAGLIGGLAAVLKADSWLQYNNIDVKGMTVNINDTDGKYAEVGGLIGQTQTGHDAPVFTNCDITGFDVTASGKVTVGGFIARPGAHTTAKNCTTEGVIDVTGVTSANEAAGGFLGNLGWNNNESSRGGHKISNCSADVEITTKVAPAGGFVGSATNEQNRNMAAAFTNCTASGDITAVEDGTANIGAFAGEADRGTYTDCFASGTVTNNGSGTDGQFIGAVEDGSNPKVIVNIAMIGNTKYSSLATAVEKAVEGDTIVLIKDFEVDETVVIDKNLTIDGDGYTIKGKDVTETETNGTAVTPITINGAEVTLVDITVKGGNAYNDDPYQPTASHGVAGAGLSVTDGKVIIDDSTIAGGDAGAEYTKSAGSSIVAVNSDIVVTDSTLATGRLIRSNVVGVANVYLDAASTIDLTNVILDTAKSTYVSDNVIASVSDNGQDTTEYTGDVKLDGEILVNGVPLANVNIVAGENLTFKGNIDSSLISDTITVKYVKKDVDAQGEDNDEEKDLYDIVLEGNKPFINRLTTADLTFVLTSTTTVKPVYEILPVKPVTITTDADYENRYMFNFDGVTQPDETAKEIVIGQVSISGYGAYTFGVATADTNLVNATKTNDSVVENFIPGGAQGKGVLVIDATIADEIVVPTRDLTINIDFPNAVEKKAADYQQMKVTVSGGDLAEAIVIELGDADTETAIATEYEKKDAKFTIDADAAYTVTVEEVLTVNTSYTVTVEGAGYRTYRYTVTMTEAKTLNFWNNVKDNETAIEEGKKTAKVTYLAGDIVKDSLINVYDLSAVVSYFGETELVGNNNTYAKYDLNRDGKIDSKDVAYVLVSWGK